MEQTESVDAMNERTRGRPASEKVVRREVCQLLTPGTCTATDRAEVSHVDHMSQGDEDLSQMREVVDDSSSYLIAVSERRSQVNEECEFGIALLNAVTGKIMVDFRKAGLIRCILAWSVHRRRASFSPPDAFRSLPSQSGKLICTAIDNRGILKECDVFTFKISMLAAAAFIMLVYNLPQ